MRSTLVALVFVASCLPAMAAMAEPLPPQGNFTVVSGRAHIVRGAQGTYVRLERRGTDIAGFIPFGDQSMFRGLYELEGRRVAIQGVVVLDGEAMIVLTDPGQLSVG